MRQLDYDVIRYLDYPFTNITMIFWHNSYTDKKIKLAYNKAINYINHFKGDETEIPTIINLGYCVANNWNSIPLGQEELSDDVRRMVSDFWYAFEKWIDKIKLINIEVYNTLHFEGYAKRFLSDDKKFNYRKDNNYYSYTTKYKCENLMDFKEYIIFIKCNTAKGINLDGIFKLYNKYFNKHINGYREKEKIISRRNFKCDEIVIEDYKF